MFKLSEELTVILMAASPVLELRIALPYAIQVYGMPLVEAFVLAVAGNILPVAPILLLLDPVSNFLMRYKIFNKFFTWLFERTRKKSDIIEKYEVLGLTIFVAISLPLAGAWTACVAAFLFGIRFWYAFTAIGLGVFISGVIILCLIKLGYVGAVIAAVALIGTAVVGLYEFMIKKK